MWTCLDCGQVWERREGDYSRWRDPGKDSVRALCPHCRQEGFWPWPPAGDNTDENHFTPPRGHTVKYLDAHWTTRTDTCPVLTEASLLYDPRPPWAPLNTTEEDR
ncbi:hypothetical protein AB0F88_39990 [Streptosporangium sp. NPDC023963]|uniref:hypothetical protein n=1 Tax=Streptosporangium sp. NPDC023963 TaxID=3155608 RepID=UPI0034290F90